MDSAVADYAGRLAILVYTQMSSEINVLASWADGKRTVPYLLMLVLSYVSLGIYACIWEHQFASRIHAEWIRRECDVSFDVSDFWLWGVLRAFILVGPFVYRHKQLTP